MLWTALPLTSPSSTVWCCYHLLRTHTPYSKIDLHHLALLTNTCSPMTSRCPQPSPLMQTFSPYRSLSPAQGLEEAVLSIQSLLHLTPFPLLTLTFLLPSLLLMRSLSHASPTPLWEGPSWKRSSSLWLHRLHFEIFWDPVVAPLCQKRDFVSLQSHPTLPLHHHLWDTAKWHWETTARVHPLCEAEMKSWGVCKNSTMERKPIDSQWIKNMKWGVGGYGRVTASCI